jgi:hypothetical protein
MGAWERDNGGRKVAVAQRKARAAGARATGARERRRREWDQPLPQLTLLIEGSTQSIHYGSLLRTTRPNGFIPRSQQEDQGGFFANRPSATT